jgi:hypothetical protein
MTLEACNGLKGTAWDGCKSRRSAPAKKEVDMLNSFKSKAPERDKNATANVAEAIGNMAQPQHSVVEEAAARLEPTTKAGTASCLGSGMSIVGNIECSGPAQVFGRIKGELRAAVRVKLQDGGAVEGDIFHRSLSIDENSLFEGSSRRVENPTDPSLVDAKGSQKEDILHPVAQRRRGLLARDEDKIEVGLRAK